MKYKIILEILGEKREASGGTIDEALASFGLEWNQIKGKGTLTVFSGSQKHEHLMSMRILRRVFSNKIMRMHWAKNLEYLLKADVTTNIPKDYGKAETNTVRR